MFLFLRLCAPRTTRHIQVRDAFISQRCSQIPVLCVYEWAASRLISVRVLFGTDEHDHLSSKLITSLTTMGCRTFWTCAFLCQPARSILSALTGGRLAHMPSRHSLYQSHIRTCGKICDMHDLRFVPLAFDSLGRMHPDSAILFHKAFITVRRMAGWAERSTRLRLLP